MFEAGILGTIEYIGYSIRNNMFIATHPEIWESNLRKTAGGHLLIVRPKAETIMPTEELLKEIRIQLDSKEEFSDETREQILSFVRSMAECVDDFSLKNSHV